MIKKLRLYQNISQTNRKRLLNQLIKDFLNKKISKSELRSALENIYNRTADQRSTISPGQTPHMLTDSDPLYLQIYDTIISNQPQSQDLRQDQIESLTNTVSAHAATKERINQYQSRGVQFLEIVAYIDDATTDICRAMNGRVFELAPAAQTLANQEQLVQPESFWAAQDHFANTPTSQLSAPWLPPYHYNCRTRVVPFIQPTGAYDQAIINHDNLNKIQDIQVQAILNKVMKLSFSSENLSSQFQIHAHDLGINSRTQYIHAIKNLIKNPLSNSAIAISKKTGHRLLFLFSPKEEMVQGKKIHHFATVNLSKNYILSLQPKSISQINDEIDPKKLDKIIWLNHNP